MSIRLSIEFNDPYVMLEEYDSAPLDSVTRQVLYNELIMMLQNQMYVNSRRELDAWTARVETTLAESEYAAKQAAVADDEGLVDVHADELEEVNEKTGEHIVNKE